MGSQLFCASRLVLSTKVQTCQAGKSLPCTPGLVSVMAISGQLAEWCRCDAPWPGRHRDRPANSPGHALGKHEKAIALAVLARAYSTQIRNAQAIALATFPERCPTSVGLNKRPRKACRLPISSPAAPVWGVHHRETTSSSSCLYLVENQDHGFPAG